MTEKELRIECVKVAFRAYRKALRKAADCGAIPKDHPVLLDEAARLAGKGELADEVRRKSVVELSKILEGD